MSKWDRDEYRFDPFKKDSVWTETSDDLNTARRTSYSTGSIGLRAQRVVLAHPVSGADPGGVHLMAYDMTGACQRLLSTPDPRFPGFHRLSVDTEAEFILSGSATWIIENVKICSAPSGFQTTASLRYLRSHDDGTAYVYDTFLESASVFQGTTIGPTDTTGSMPMLFAWENLPDVNVVGDGEAVRSWGNRSGAAYVVVGGHDQDLGGYRQALVTHDEEFSSVLYRALRVDSELNMHNSSSGITGTEGWYVGNIKVASTGQSSGSAYNRYIRAHDDGTVYDYDTYMESTSVWHDNPISSIDSTGSLMMAIASDEWTGSHVVDPLDATHLWANTTGALYIDVGAHDWDYDGYRKAFLTHDEEFTSADYRALRVDSEFNMFNSASGITGNNGWYVGNLKVGSTLQSSGALYNRYLLTMDDGTLYVHWTGSSYHHQLSKDTGSMLLGYFTSAFPEQVDEQDAIRWWFSKVGEAFVCDQHLSASIGEHDDPAPVSASMGGAYAKDDYPTSVDADGDVVRIWASRQGEVFVKEKMLENALAEHDVSYPVSGAALMGYYTGAIPDTVNEGDAVRLQATNVGELLNKDLVLEQAIGLHDDTYPASSSMAGLYAKADYPTVVDADGDAVRAWGSLQGELYTKNKVQDHAIGQHDVAAPASGSVLLGYYTGAVPDTVDEGDVVRLQSTNVGELLNKDLVLEQGMGQNDLAAPVSASVIAGKAKADYPAVVDADADAVNFWASMQGELYTKNKVQDHAIAQHDVVWPASGSALMAYYTGAVPDVVDEQDAVRVRATSDGQLKIRTEIIEDAIGLHDTVVPASGAIMMGIASSSIPAAVDENDACRLWVSPVGALKTERINPITRTNDEIKNEPIMPAEIPTVGTVSTSATVGTMVQLTATSDSLKDSIFVRVSPKYPGNPLIGLSPLSTINLCIDADGIPQEGQHFFAEEGWVEFKLDDSSKIYVCADQPAIPLMFRST